MSVTESESELHDEQEKIFKKTKDFQKRMAERHTTDFHGMFAFLLDYWWIHDTQLTKYFVEQMWSKVPEQWNKILSRLSAEQLGRLPFEVSAQSSPCAKCVHSPCVKCMLSCSDGHVEESLASFLHRSAQLSCDRQQASYFLSSTPVDRELARGMTPKKIHEVEWMASLVHHVTAKSGCNVVVDVGSGLGYLGQVLHKVYGLPVIGIEGNIGHSEGAAIRASKQGLECSGLKTVALEICDDKENFQKFATVITEALSSLLPCPHTSGHLESSESLGNKTRSKHPNADGRGSDFAGKTGCFWNERCDDLGNFEETESADGQCRTKSHQTEYCCHVCSGRRTTGKCSDADCNVGLSNLFSKKTIFECLQLPEDIRTTECSCSLHNIRETRLLNHEHHRTASEGWENQLTCSHKQRGHKGHCGDDQSNAEHGGMTGDVRLSKGQWESRNVPCSYRKEQLDMRNRKVCLVGLHCCGDLSPIMLKLFHHVEFISAVVCVSCCYHKMQKISGKDGFYNFPLSEMAKQAYETAQKNVSNSSPPHLLSTGSLRLAAQETRTRWAAQRDTDHESHTRNLAYRALLEVFLTENQQALVPQRKKIRKLNYSSFDSFVNSFLAALSITEDEKKDMKKEMHRLYFQLQPHFQSIEPFTCLQVVLQPVLESLIVWDREQWLVEQGYQPSIVAIFDPDISPRNLASVCIKE